MKVPDKHFPAVLFVILQGMVTTFKTMDEIFKWNAIRISCYALISFYFVVVFFLNFVFSEYFIRLDQF